jgi:hypothetical protein
MRRTMISILIAAVLVLMGGLSVDSVSAHVVVCDFTTGGGWILIPPGTATSAPPLVESGDKANFGLVGGCKNGGFYGHVNYVDHNNRLHVSSMIPILGYFCPNSGCTPNSRDICGTARTDLLGNVFFRVRTIDAEAQSPPGQKDKFGIKLIGQNPDGTSSGVTKYLVPTRCLADGIPTGNASTCTMVNPGGGDIELHKPNNSNTGPSVPPDEFTACGGDDSGLGF